jgi:hypothetical protein
MQLTERDRKILEAIHAYDGMLGFSQIQRLFFGGRSQTEHRMMLLYQNKYVNRPNKEERRRTPEMIYWLDKPGAEIVAGMEGATLSELNWRRKPRWFQVDHDLAVNDFRIEIKNACEASSKVSLENWIPESEFWAHPDKVEYKYKGKDKIRYVRPDGFFTLTTGKHRIRYLLEIDRSTETNLRFYREKILPGLAYIMTQDYKENFGYNSGRWLVITTNENRMTNMKIQAKRANAKGVYYFTTYEKIQNNSLLFSPIWHRADRDDLVPLIFID